MMTVDTSAWVEWMQDSPLGRSMASLLPAPADCIMPTIVQLELAKWAMRKGDAAWLKQMLGFTLLCQVRPLDSRTAHRAAHMHRRLKLATADAIIYATARRFDAPLLTCDAHFAHLPSVIYFRKS